MVTAERIEAGQRATSAFAKCKATYGDQYVYEEPETIVVTRHPSLVDYLRERGIIDERAHVIEHACADDVRGKHVIGVLPLHLAALAASVTEVPLDLPAELRGQELTLGQLRQYAGAPVTYYVTRADE